MAVQRGIGSRQPETLRLKITLPVKDEAAARRKAVELALVNYASGRVHSVHLEAVQSRDGIPTGATRWVTVITFVVGQPPRCVHNKPPVIIVESC
jgi:hypothetical protein